jgi:hypothetical protein
MPFRLHPPRHGYKSNQAQHKERGQPRVQRRGDKRPHNKDDLMVVRKEKRKRKYFGTRRWGVGNIKNARGAGSRGGTGLAGSGLGTGSKHKFTYITAHAPELIRKVGFTPWNQTEAQGDIAQGGREACSQGARRRDDRAQGPQGAEQRNPFRKGNDKGSRILEGCPGEDKGLWRRGDSGEERSRSSTLAAEGKARRKSSSLYKPVNPRQQDGRVP